MLIHLNIKSLPFDLVSAWSQFEIRKAKIKTYDMPYSLKNSEKRYFDSILFNTLFTYRVR